MYSLHAISYTIKFCIINDILFLLKLIAASTDGLTATCSAFFEILQLLNLANNKLGKTKKMGQSTEAIHVSPQNNTTLSSSISCIDCKYKNT